jgi:GDP-L-fucose synthase
MNLQSKRITITGGKGFLGTHLIRLMQDKGYQDMAIADLPEYNLVDIADVRQLYKEIKPDVVIHLAAKVGGIGYNQANPASLFYENAMMGIQLMHEAHVHRIDKFVALGTICAYPKYTPVPFKEDDIWNGYPEETNAPYGLAKKMMLVQSQAYRQQYGFNSIFFLPVNLYGPGDNFSFRSSHVIPALIRKFHIANLLSVGDYVGIVQDLLFNKETTFVIDDKKFVIGYSSSIEDILFVLRRFGISLSDAPGLSSIALASNASGRPSSIGPSSSSIGSSTVVEVWGTGAATREFFYVEDAAEAIILATEKYDKSEPVNIGAGFEISIRELVDLLIKLTGFQGRLEWNTAKPDGQPRRMLDTAKAYEEFGFMARTNFEEGLKKTIEWYETEKDFLPKSRKY